MRSVATVSSCAVLAAAMFALVAGGCGGSHDGEFHTYDQLEKSPSATGSTEHRITSDARIAPDEAGVTERVDSAPRAPAVAPKPDAIELASATSTSDADSATTATPSGSPRAGKLDAGASGEAPREIKVLVPEKQFRMDGRGKERALRVSYDDIDLLKVINMEPVSMDAPEHMPGWLKTLDGQRVRIRGFMYPPYAETGLDAFALARDNQICCFGKNFKVYDVFPVMLREGVTTDYILNRPFDVVGVFHIKPRELDGKVMQLYQIDDAIVIEN